MVRLKLSARNLQFKICTTIKQAQALTTLKLAVPNCKIKIYFYKVHLPLARHHSTGWDRTRHLERAEMESLSSKLKDSVSQKAKKIQISYLRTVHNTITVAKRKKKTHPNAFNPLKTILTDNW